MIGTIDNITLCLAWRYVRSRTHICLVAERQVNIRPHSKTARRRPSLFISLSLSFYPSPPRSRDPPRPGGYHPRYPSIGVDQPAAAHFLLLSGPNPR